jgi:hypothetical protein
MLRRGAVPANDTPAPDRATFGPVRDTGRKGLAASAAVAAPAPGGGGRGPGRRGMWGSGAGPGACAAGASRGITDAWREGHGSLTEGARPCARRRNVTPPCVSGDTHSGAFVFCPAIRAKYERTPWDPRSRARRGTEDARDVHESRATSRPSPYSPRTPHVLGVSSRSQPARTSMRGPGHSSTPTADPTPARSPLPRSGAGGRGPRRRSPRVSPRGRRASAARCAR